MEECSLKIQESHENWHSFVNSVKFEVPPSEVPKDVKSQAYLEYQLNLWRIVSGRDSYDIDICEANNNLKSVNSIVDTYPFVTKDRTTITNYFMGVVSIFDKIGLVPPANIVEFGVGWGHTTRFLANCGFSVTALDIERDFLDLIPKFSLPGTPEVALVHAAFHEGNFAANSFDAALFYECFHHSLDHRELVSQLRSMLRSNGKIVFCAEAFYDDWFDFPWGLRLDGHSVWAIRNFGWMELGFRKSYINELLAEFDFIPEWSAVPSIGPIGEFLVASLNKQ
tara:strand:- start:29600 stop:30442 length:843 start_codon:yes stop_codon:yes gene_type:complete